MLKPCLFLVPLLCFSPPASAWGGQGHRMLATAALRDLPPAAAAWFQGQEATLPDHANDPDHWKERDAQERPRHFLDSEAYGGPAQVPFGEEAARALLGPEAFQQAGQVPWAILDRVQRLTRAFQAGDPAQAAFEASILSHYVGDLSVPLHTTQNHNGDLTGQHGVHGRWETGLLERIVEEEGWLPEVRPALPVPEQAPWTWLQGSFTLVPGILADDQAAAAAPAAEGLRKAYWAAFRLTQGPHVKEQLTLSAQRTAQMILLAWTKAGSPPAPQPSR